MKPDFSAFEENLEVKYSKSLKEAVEQINKEYREFVKTLSWNMRFRLWLCNLLFKNKPLLK